MLAGAKDGSTASGRHPDGASAGLGAAATALAAGDFNGDDKADIAAAVANQTAVQILTGGGDGSFQLQASYSTGVNPVSMAVADFNGDGRPDLAILCQDGSINILLGASLSVLATGGTPQSAMVGTAFAPLQVLVSDSNGNPVSGVAVNFTAPSAGAAGIFAGGAVTAVSQTNLQGLASSPAFTANGTPGQFTVTATVTAALSAAFSLSNIPLPSLSVVKTHSGSLLQGQNGAQYTITVGNAATAGPTSGTVAVTEKPPGGLTLASMAGTGWTCSAGGTTCTREPRLGRGALQEQRPSADAPAQSGHGGISPRRFSRWRHTAASGFS